MLVQSNLSRFQLDRFKWNIWWKNLKGRVEWAGFLYCIAIPEWSVAADEASCYKRHCVKKCTSIVVLHKLQIVLVLFQVALVCFWRRAKNYIVTLQFHKQNQMSHEYLLVVNLKLTLAALSSTSTLTLGSQIKAPRYKSTSIGGLM